MSRLSRADWAKAALEVIGEQGEAGVAVEPLAARLGTTKGSFYWHFKARDELISAALELWEERSTTDVITRVEAAGGEPADRLRLLFAIVFDPDALTGADVALLAHLDDPGVEAAVERVTQRRISYLTRLLRQAGQGPTLARRRAMLVYCAYLGHLHLARHTPQLVADVAGPPERYLDDVLRTLLAP